MRGKYVLAFAALSGVASAIDLGNVMCVGDSITCGAGGEMYGLPNGYRGLLASQLTADGDTFTYVGQSMDRPGLPNEGHAGWGIDNFYQGNTGNPGALQIQDWIARDHPDTILLMCGTNDGPSPESILRQKYTTLLDTIYALAPAERVVWASIPASNAAHTLRQDWDPMVNALVHTMVGEQVAAGRNVLYADVYDGFNYSTDLFDDVHPNDLGYAKIADAFEVAIHPVGRNSAGSPTPEPATIIAVGLGALLIRRRGRPRP